MSSEIVNQQSDGEGKDPLLVRTGVRKIELSHAVDEKTGTVTIFDADDLKEGVPTEWISSDTAVKGRAFR